MINVKLMKICDRMRLRLGALPEKNMKRAADKAISYKQKLFNQQHRSRLVSFDFREFFCGNCEIRQNYLNKQTKDSFVKEADQIKGIF